MEKLVYLQNSYAFHSFLIRCLRISHQFCKIHLFKLFLNNRYLIATRREKISKFYRKFGTYLDNVTFQ